MTKGTRVVTPLGPGGVAYVRMAAPNYATPEAVSVVLDARRADPNYSGTIFPAADVRPVGGRFPVFPTHDAARCIDCNGALEGHRESGYPPREGEQRALCPKCDRSTFYDLAGGQP